MLDYVIFDNDTGKFFTPILPATPKKKKPGRNSAIEASIARKIKDLGQTLQPRDFYVPYHLADKVMGICDNAYESTGGVVQMDSSDRTYYWQQFRKALSKGLHRVLDLICFGGRTRKRPTQHMCASGRCYL